MAIRPFLFKLRLLLDRLQPRERLLLLGILVLLLAVATQSLLWSTGFAHHERERSRIDNLRAEFTANQNTLRTLQQAMNNPRVEALEERNAELKNDLQTLNQRIDAITDVLIPPQTMVTLLRELLNGNRLTLKRLQVEPAERVETGGNAASVTLYRHPMVLELNGDYDALVGYLKSIEALPWQLFWDELSVETEDHPRLNIRLRVHTLSDQEVWLNV